MRVTQSTLVVNLEKTSKEYQKLRDTFTKSLSSQKSYEVIKVRFYFSTYLIYQHMA
jgi:hypothetical protein